MAMEHNCVISIYKAADYRIIDVYVLYRSVCLHGDVFIFTEIFGAMTQGEKFVCMHVHVNEIPT